MSELGGNDDGGDDGDGDESAPNGLRQSSRHVTLGVNFAAQSRVDGDIEDAETGRDRSELLQQVNRKGRLRIIDTSELQALHTLWMYWDGR